MKLAIVGGRNYKQDDGDDALIDRHRPTMIITGDANGADKMARNYASRFGINLVVVPALWDFYGKAAGPIRNRVIADLCDEMLAFPGGNGTCNSIDTATALGKRVYVVSNGRPWTATPPKNPSDRA